MKEKIYKKTETEIFVIPMGDPPPGTGEKPNLEGLKKFRQIKVPLLKKLSMQKDEGTNPQKTNLPVL